MTIYGRQSAWEGLVPFFDGGKFCARATCATCGANRVWRSERGGDPSISVKRARQSGWRLGRITCPDCVAKAKEKKVNTKANVTPIKADTQIPSPDARQKRRDAHELIALAFDLANGIYKDGYSDARIAKETGLSEDWVARRREDEFGPLKEPDELAALRAELVGAAQTIAQVQAKFEALSKKMGWAA